MRKLMLTVAALAAGALSLNGVAAQQTQTEQQAQQGQEDMKVTGMVTEVDKDTNEITVDDKTFIMSDTGGGAAMMPQVGAEVTLFYREEGDKNLITRIGQAQQ
jgi:Cu/Ag efflux protein CusF